MFHFRSPSNFDGGLGALVPALMRLRASAVKPNSPAYLTMSAACLRAMLTNGFVAASPYLFLISWPSGCRPTTLNLWVYPKPANQPEDEVLYAPKSAVLEGGWAKLGLNLASEPNESGRVYRIIDDMATPAKADRVKQAA